MTLVERLRGLNAEHPPFGAAHEAADRIEELERVARMAQQWLDWYVTQDENNALSPWNVMDVIIALRAALEGSEGK